MAKKIIFITAIILLVILSSCTQKNTKSNKNRNNKDTSKETNSNKYRILYSRSENQVVGNNQLGITCFNFSLFKHIGGGIIKEDGKNNKLLKIKEFFMGTLNSAKYNDYYYISSTSSPSKKMMNYNVFDFNAAGQTVWSDEFDSGNLTKVAGLKNKQFPADILASKNNKYLAYVMVTSSGSNSLALFDPNIKSGELVIRNTETGTEKRSLKGIYNRQLFKCFSQFSEKANAFYTIAIAGGNFKFVKVNADTGVVEDFSKLFTNFDFTKVDWKGLVASSGFESNFVMSPDEKIILAGKNKTKVNKKNVCAPGSDYTLYAINLGDNTLKTYKQESGYLNGITWKSDSNEFAIILLTCGGCYPDYMDSKIIKFDKDGKNEDVLVEEKKSKINSFGWAPSGEKIAFTIYGNDYLSKLKVVNAWNKQQDEVTNSNQTEKTINKKLPVILTFRDWVIE